LALSEAKPNVDASTVLCLGAAYIAMNGRRLDLAYWFFFTPLVTGGLTRCTTLGAIALLTILVPRPTIDLGLTTELVLALVVADIVGYWSHRLRHSNTLWRFHAIHHSPTKLDALAAARMHPVDDVIDNTLVGAVLFAAGFSTETVFAIGPILFLHIALTHADVDWDFGLFRKVLVSPAHHRAHHEIGAAQNYAGMFSFIDMLFGTYGETSGGSHGAGEPIPESLRAHLAWPLRISGQVVGGLDKM
jgi:sterol desaturase/sphingolipid hydroxylase (fatty acid hydroxylase superfamily)